MKLTQNMKDALKGNICYFATSSKDGKPNVVPMGLVEPIGDSQLMIVDVRMNKTRKNLAENEQVALAFTNSGRLQAYQFKGKAKVITSGELFDNAVQITKEKVHRRRHRLQHRLEETSDPEIRKKIEAMMDRDRVPKATILIDIEEIYPTM